jgi:hypothetical protein
MRKSEAKNLKKFPFSGEKRVRERQGRGKSEEG